MMMEYNAKVDIFAQPEFPDIETANPDVEDGGKWQPKDCTPWQKVGECLNLVTNKQYKVDNTAILIQFDFHCFMLFFHPFLILL